MNLKPTKKTTRLNRKSSNELHLAEGEGFEPPDSCPSTVFKTAAFDRSANLPFVPLL